MKRSTIIACLLALAAPATMAQTPAAGPAAPAAQGALQPLPHANGPFSAILLPIPQAQLAEFDKPSDQAPKLTRVSQAKVGDQVAMKIIFLGAERDAQGRVDVSYDLKFTGPDGKPYGSTSEWKDLEALKFAVPADPGYLDNRRAVAGIGFEAEDAPGVYRIDVVLHDNVGKRDIPLTAQVELKK